VPRESIAVFRNRKGNLIKLLSWDGSGPVIHYRRLETRTVNWPAMKKGHKTITIEPEELMILLHGYNTQEPSQRIGMQRELAQNKSLLPAWPRLPEGAEL
jgi:transposase